MICFLENSPKKSSYRKQSMPWAWKAIKSHWLNHRQSKSQVNRKKEQIQRTLGVLIWEIENFKAFRLVNISILKRFNWLERLPWLNPNQASLESFRKGKYLLIERKYGPMDCEGIDSKTQFPIEQKAMNYSVLLLEARVYGLLIDSD